MRVLTCRENVHGMSVKRHDLAQTRPVEGTRPEQPTLANELDHVRLRHRARRVEAALAVLRLRESERKRAGAPVPPALREALADFGRELGTLRHQLRRLDHGAHKPAPGSR
jgi:hypothetical protein